MSDQFFLVSTHGADDPERATIPFVMATAAQASDVHVIIGLQVDGVEAVVKGGAGAIQAPEFPPLADLIEIYLEQGGVIHVCGPCAKSRGITPDDLIDGASIVAAGTFVKEIADATNVAVY